MSLTMDFAVSAQRSKLERGAIKTPKLQFITIEQARTLWAYRESEAKVEGPVTSFFVFNGQRVVVNTTVPACNKIVLN